MPRHDLPLLPARRRLEPLRRAVTTAGLSAAALVVGVGGYGVATSPALAAAPGDRFAIVDLFGGADDQTATAMTTPSAADRDRDRASRAERTPLQPGLPTTASQAQSWVDEVGSLEAALDTRAEQEAARVAAEKEAERVAAQEEAERVAAQEEAERVAAQEEAERVAAQEEAAQEQAAQEQAAQEQAAQEQAAQEQAAQEQAAASAPADPGSNRALAQSLLGAYGFGADQWSCLDNLWQKESNWNHLAKNPSSSAYGIPQSLPGSKMATVGPDWQTNPETQIRWGLGYIAGRYGTPCSAWAHSQANNWY